MTNTIEHRIMTGDKLSFELLFRRFFAPLCSFANKFHKYQTSEKEIVQDGFLKHWDFSSSFHRDGSVKSLLYQEVPYKSLILISYLKVVKRYSETIVTVYARPKVFDILDRLCVKKTVLHNRSFINVPAFLSTSFFLMSPSQVLRNFEIVPKLSISICRNIKNQMNRARKKLSVDLFSQTRVINSIALIHKKIGNNKYLEHLSYSVFISSPPSHISQIELIGQNNFG